MCKIRIFKLSIVLFFSFCVALNYSLANENAMANKYIEKANQLELYKSKKWLALLHFNRNAFGIFKSIIDSKSFFLDNRGYKNPKGELNATIRAFFNEDITETETKQHAICAYPARFEFLNKHLNFSPNELPKPDCNRFKEFFNEVEPYGLSIIFPTTYINNPASMFGHTLIRIDKKGNYEMNSHLNSIIINYGADTKGEISGIIYAFRGVFGLYSGFFSASQYYKITNNYGNLENRDIWEYRLNYTKEEAEFYTKHMWELIFANSDYYFFKRNCSYMILESLNPIRPELNLTRSFLFSTSPIDTIRLLKNNNIIVENNYRMSLEKQIKYANLSKKEKKIVNKMVMDTDFLDKYGKKNNKNIENVNKSDNENNVENTDKNNNRDITENTTMDTTENTGENITKNINKNTAENTIRNTNENTTENTDKNDTINNTENKKNKEDKKNEKDKNNKNYEEYDGENNQEIFETAYKLLQYKKARNEIDLKFYRKQIIKMLKNINKNDGNFEKSIDKYEIISPDNGHYLKRLRINFGYFEGKKNFIELNYKPVYHDLTDDGEGFEFGSTISFFDMAFRYYFEDRDFELEKFNFVDIKSLALRDTFFKPTSFSVLFGVNNLYDDYKVLMLDTNGGFTFGTENIAFFILAGLKINENRYFENDFVLGFNGTSGLLLNFQDKVKLLLNYKINKLTKSKLNYNQFLADFNVILNKNFNINFGYNNFNYKDFDNREELIVGIRYFF